MEEAETIQADGGGQEAGGRFRGKPGKIREGRELEYGKNRILADAFQRDAPAGTDTKERAVDKRRRML